MVQSRVQVPLWLPTCTLHMEPVFSCQPGGLGLGDAKAPSIRINCPPCLHPFPGHAHFCSTTPTNEPRPLLTNHTHFYFVDLRDKTRYIPPSTFTPIRLVRNKCFIFPPSGYVYFPSLRLISFKCKRVFTQLVLLSYLYVKAIKWDITVALEIMVIIALRTRAILLTTELDVNYIIFWLWFSSSDHHGTLQRSC